jgi:hypothetical protein
LLLETGLPVYAASIGLGLAGFALGYGLSRTLRQDTRRSRTIALETGIQNGPLAVLIVLLTFTGDAAAEVLLIPVLYSLFIVLTSSAVTVWFRRITTREELARDAAKIGPPGSRSTRWASSAARAGHHRQPRRDAAAVHHRPEAGHPHAAARRGLGLGHAAHRRLDCCSPGCCSS